MRPRNRLRLLVALGAVALAAHAAAGTRFIKADNPDFAYAGRIDFSNRQAPRFYWAGDAATIGFTGSTLAVVLDNAAGDNYFDVIIDGDGVHRHVIHCRKGRHTYIVARHLTGARHTAKILRRVDPTYSVSEFDGIEIGPHASVFRPSVRHPLAIEFYGDSITSGYGVLDTTRHHNANPATMDSYLSYAAITARHFHADYRSISLSGIGILKSWFPLTMPSMYARLNPRDPASHWNFSKWTPDIVVINLLQNDSWLLPREKHPPSKEQIISAYMSFVESLRSHYPHAIFICMLGDMDITKPGSPWAGYVKAAVRRMRADGDNGVYPLIVPYKRTPGHPNAAEQQAMAQMLIEKIESFSFPFSVIPAKAGMTRSG
ncbi:MAG TPA: SGNH/GDSL hydrolase family protein [Gammaproteobacteria bacterium]|nr:SGNH/GDSL hydrolase family protein [Gammaproteobacteria bacterium]